jgi:hypothetical protein
MAYKTGEEALSAERLMQNEIKGIWEHKGFLISRYGEHNLCRITTADPEEKLPKPLMGMFTEPELAKTYINNFLESNEKN